ncbi:MAG: potassium/proton antiporter [Bacteroidales bacterium]|nr:potassium/proton antiporter [Bacteroidales bacterium]
MPLAVFSLDLLSENMLLLVALLFFAAILLSKIGARIGVPVLLLFLVLGVVVGSEGLGINFEDYHLAESMGHFAMTVILFASGLETSARNVKPVMRQGMLLSSAGVFLNVIFTGLFVFFVLRPFADTGLQASVAGCMLVAAVMSSTDSASVFSVLREKRLRLRENLGQLLELESGSNDPMAFILTLLLVQYMAPGSYSIGIPGPEWLNMAVMLVLQVGIGLAVGLAAGTLGSWLLSRIKLPGGSLYSILILSLGFLADGLAGVLGGNGLLAIYVAALIIGNHMKGSFTREVFSFFNGMTWLMQLSMFLMLGLLARPSMMGVSALPSLLIGLFMMFVARPLSVFICLAPFKDLSFRAKLMVSWVGLKGAGPILFALSPVVAGLEGAGAIFNLVFCITLLSLVVQGSTLIPVSRWLRLSYDDEPQVESFGMELPEEMGMLRDHVVSEEDLSAGATLRELSLPHGIRVMMVRRDGKFLVPHGSMKLQAGDHLLIVMGESDD